MNRHGSRVTAAGIGLVTNTLDARLQRHFADMRWQADHQLPSFFIHRHVRGMGQSLILPQLYGGCPACRFVAPGRLQQPTLDGSTVKRANNQVETR